jgi:hypothetical protein
VVEGGGECGLDNYRTLCTPCHKVETKKLAKRLAEKRKQDAKVQLPLSDPSGVPDQPGQPSEDGKLP